MILQALAFLTQELNTYLKGAFNTPQTRAVLAAHVGPAGESSAELDNQMSLTLINIGTEPTLRNQQPSRSGSGPHQQQNPALKLKLRVLVAANFGDYSEALKFLGSTLAFFQSCPSLATTPGTPLDAAIDRLTVELEDTSYQD